LNNKKAISKLLLLAFLALFGSVVFGQSSCPNIDFELGSYGSWKGVQGVNSANDYEIQNPTAGFTDQGQLNNTDFVHAIIDSQRGYTWGAGANNSSPINVDPYVRTLPLSPPWGGRYVSRLGKMSGDDVVGSISYTIDVDANNALLQVYFAIVLEAPTHTPEQNPYFRISLIDQHGAKVDCIEYVQEGNKNATGFIEHSGSRGPDGATNVTYRPWTINSINLLPYVGQTVTFEITAGGCNLGAHFGYAYVDARCSKPELLKSEAFVCDGTTVNLTAPDGMDSYQWRKGAATGPIISTTKVVNVGTAGAYFCTMVPASTANTSCPFTLSVIVDEAPSKPTPDFTVVPLVSCPGTEFTFTDKSTTKDGSPIKTYSWDFGDGSPKVASKNPKHIYNSVGTYTITLTITSKDGCIATITKQVKVQKGAKPILAGPKELCENDSPVQYTSNTSGTWSGPGVNSAGIFNPKTAASSGSGPYVLNFTDKDCGESASITVTVFPIPDAKFKPVGPFCEGDPSVFIIPNTTGGVFSGIGVVGNKFDPKVSGVGNHQVFYEVTSAKGCKNNSVLVAVVNAIPRPKINPPGSFCTIDGPVQLTASLTGGTWTGSSVTAAGIFSPGSATIGDNQVIYTLKSTCTGADTILISVNDNPSAKFTIPKQVCEDAATITIVPESGGGQWSGKGIADKFTGSFSPSLAGPGTHTITYEIKGSCGDMHQEKIEVIEIKDAAFQDAPELCEEGNPYTFLPTTPGGTWSGNFISAAGVFDPKISKAGTFNVTYSFGGMCPSKYTSSVTVKGKISANFTGIATQCIANPNVQLVADNPGGTWSGNGIINTTTGMFSPSAAGAGSHTITYSITGLCGDAVSKILTVVDAPSPSIEPVNPLCANANKVVLTAKPNGGSWFINGGASTAEFDPAMYGAGTHKVKYIINGTCSAEDAIDIIVAAPIQATLLNKQNETCFEACDASISVATTGGFGALKYEWKNELGNVIGTGSVLNNLCPNRTTGSQSYTLKITDEIFCGTNFAEQITGPKNPIAFTISGFAASCGQNNGMVFIETIPSGGTPAYSLQWENVATAAVISSQDTVNNLSGNNIYKAIITDANGCTLENTFYVDDTPGPTVPSSQINASCKAYTNASAKIDVANIVGGKAPYAIKWLDANQNQISTNNQISNLSAGLYYFTVTDADGCFTSDTLELLEPDSVQIKAVSANPLFLCQDETGLLEVLASQLNTLGAPPGFTFEWSPNAQGSNNATYAVNAPGTFKVFAKNSLGCISKTLTLDVTQAGALSTTMYPNAEICPKEDVLFFADAHNGVSSYNYEWVDLETGIVLATTTDNFFTIKALNKPPGIYTYQVNISDGCSTPTSATAEVTVNPLPVISFVGMDLEGCVPISPTLRNTSLNLSNFTWKVSNGATVINENEISPVLPEVGNYDVILIGVNQYGCVDSLVKANYLKVFPYPRARIDYQPGELDIYTKQVQFLNRTNLPNCIYQWTIVNIDKSDTVRTTQFGPFYPLDGIPGIIDAKLFAVSSHGCADSTALSITVKNAYTFYVPNTITPDGDGYNEVFHPVFDNLIPKNYSLTIWNRWGELVFETKDPYGSWDGKSLQNETVPDGVYPYQITFTDLFGEQQIKLGHVNVFR